MKLSQNTVTILKSFAGINSNLQVRAGNRIAAMNPSRTVYAAAEVAEEFPEFAIYDLSEFLGVISLFKEPEIEFDKDFLTVSEGRNKIRYTYGDPITFKVVPPESSPKMPDPEIEFNLSHSDLNSLLKAASVLKLDEIAVTNESGKFCAVVLDPKNPTSNNFSIDLEGTTSGIFDMRFKVEKMKLIPGDYKVEITTAKRYARLTNTDTELNVQYVIGLEKTSTVRDE